MTDTFPRLVGDIGGTNARFAWMASAGAPLGDIDTLPAAAHATLLDAMRHYLGRHGKAAPRWCAIGIANPIVGDRVQMTNHHWSFSISGMQRDLGLERLLVINDFTALALSLTVLPPDELRQVGGGVAVAGAPLGLLGPGTGLGVSGLLQADSGHRAIPINGEGGHVTLAATNEREDQVIDALRRRFGHASAERAVSGQGIVNLYQALCDLAVQTPALQEASDITQRGLAATDPICVEVLDLFFAFLGTVAGNLALSLGTRGGMYIGGGIVPRLGEAIDRSRFRQCFESKGRLSPYVQAIPTYVVQAKTSPALVGAARALEEL
ncbi:glucokinase [Piscinibacter sp. XHJ-5]|uniref:glucokinase n=1 Tax=Piscinibacter sp. XHJ-5 TaxID=3037797 RepID=UPI0024530803|nr:glucokinase [Piscinibacter sp. XHJ-5]